MADSRQKLGQRYKDTSERVAKLVFESKDPKTIQYAIMALLRVESEVAEKLSKEKFSNGRS